MPNLKASVDLTTVNFFQGLPKEKNQFDPGVTSQRQQVLPQVLWAMNTVPSNGNGIQSFNVMWQPVADIPTTNNPQQSLYKTVKIIDVHGNLSYALLDDTLTTGTVRTFYLLDNTKQWRPFISDNITGLPRFFHLKYTLFQTRTLFVWTLDDVLDPYWTRTGDLVSNNAVVEIDLVNHTANFHAFINMTYSDKNGITSFGNYLILFDSERIYWSSPLNFVDFTPAEGAGGSAQITEARGPIITVVPHPRGLMIYCKENIIAAEYSGDPSAPWIFTEVAGGGAILIRDDEPLVTYNEQTEQQVVYTADGLRLVSPAGVVTLDPTLEEYLGKESIEHKAVDNANVYRYRYPQTDATIFKYIKVRRLSLYGNWLFILIGEQSPTFGKEDFNRCLCWNLSTQQTAWIEGDIINVVPALDLQKAMSTDTALQLKINSIPNSFMMTKKIDPTGFEDEVAYYRNFIYDFNSTTDITPAPDVYFRFRESEVLIGRLQLNRSHMTKLYEVKLFGRISIAEENDPVDMDTLVSVRAYSSEWGLDSPVEFVYVPASRSFRGYIEGADIKVELKGTHFDVYEAQFELARGSFIC